MTNNGVVGERGDQNPIDRPFELLADCALERSISERFDVVANSFASRLAVQDTRVSLFKIITVNDEIIIGLTADELKSLGGTDAAAVAHALAQKGDLPAWQYNVKRGPGGDLQQAPSARIGLIASTSVRVEPYSTTYPVLPHP